MKKGIEFLIICIFFPLVACTLRDMATEEGEVLSVKGSVDVLCDRCVDGTNYVCRLEGSQTIDCRPAVNNQAIFEEIPVHAEVAFSGFNDINENAVPDTNEITGSISISVTERDFNATLNLSRLGSITISVTAECEELCAEGDLVFVLKKPDATIYDSWKGEIGVKEEFLVEILLGDVLLQIFEDKQKNGSFDKGEMSFSKILHVEQEDIDLGTIQLEDEDVDADGVPDGVDNCPDDPNPDQENRDGDHRGDECDECPDDPKKEEKGICDCGEPEVDSDSDGDLDCVDPCPFDFYNDEDGDTICVPDDNCRKIPNQNQTDSDGDGAGNLCDPCPQDPLDDIDGDGICADVDTCPEVFNPEQKDCDGDGEGDACDVNDNCGDNDGDGDGVPDGEDNCPDVSNPRQEDCDGDALGNACDPDDDNDGVSDGADNCDCTPNPGQEDCDGDGEGDACDVNDNCGDNDGDDDGVPDGEDNCLTVKNGYCSLDPRFCDINGDGMTIEQEIILGNQEDMDDDGDGNACDNCRDIPNSDQADTDSDALGDICDTNMVVTARCAPGDELCKMLLMMGENSEDEYLPLWNFNGNGDPCQVVPTESFVVTSQAHERNICRYYGVLINALRNRDCLAYDDADLLMQIEVSVTRTGQDGVRETVVISGPNVSDLCYPVTDENTNLYCSQQVLGCVETNMHGQ
jgi:hypothetical protein